MVDQPGFLPTLCSFRKLMLFSLVQDHHDRLDSILSRKYNAESKETYDSSAVGREDVPFRFRRRVKPKEVTDWISGMEYNYRWKVLAAFNIVCMPAQHSSEELVGLLSKLWCLGHRKDTNA